MRLPTVTKHDTCSRKLGYVGMTRPTVQEAQGCKPISFTPTARYPLQPTTRASSHVRGYRAWQPTTTCCCWTHPVADCVPSHSIQQWGALGRGILGIYAVRSDCTASTLPWFKPSIRTGWARERPRAHSSSALGSVYALTKRVTLPHPSMSLVQQGQNTHVHLKLPDLDLNIITLCTSGRLWTRQEMRSRSPAM